MAYFSLNKWLNRKTKASEQEETRSRRPRRRFHRLSLERLEERLAPAQLSYNMTASDKAVTLQLANVSNVETLQVVKDSDSSVLASQALSNTSDVLITGASGHDDQLTVNFDSGDFFSSATFNGGIAFHANSGDTDTLIVKGTGTAASDTTANYAPSSATAGSGSITVATQAADPITSIPVSFSGLTAAAALTTVQDMASFTVTPQGTAASLTVSKPAAGQNKISGASGVSIVPTTFFNIPTVTLDASAATGADTITISSDGLAASSLQNFTVKTGGGGDTVADNAASFSLPVSGGAFAVNSDGGTDKLDFSNFTGGPLTVSADKLTIAAHDGSVLMQSGTPAEKVNVNFAAGARDQVDSVLDKLSSLADKLQTGASALSQLTNQLPLLSRAVPASLGQILGFSQKISDFVTDAKNEITSLTSTFTLDTIVSDLNMLASSLPSGFGSITFTSDYRGAPGDSTSTAGQLEGLINVQMTASATASIPIDLGAGAQDVGLTVSGNIGVTASLNGNLTFGLTTETIPRAFFVPTQSASDGLNLSVSASVNPLNASLSLGFLSASISNGSITFSGGVHAGLTDPKTDSGDTAGQEITLTELTSALAGSPSSLVTVPTPTTSFSASLPVSINAGVQVANINLLNAVMSLSLPNGSSIFSAPVPTFSLLGGPKPSVGLTLSATTGTGVTVTADADVFKASDVGGQIFYQGGAALIQTFTDARHVTVDVLNDFSSTSLSSGSWLLGDVNLLDFSNITPGEVMGLLGGVFNTFISIAGNSVLSTPIPFTGKTVGDLLDYGKAFKAEVLDPLFKSHDALRPDDDGDGVPDFNFASIQDLVDKLSLALGLPAGTIKASYDPSTKELSFGLSFDRALGFGQANVAEKQQGSASQDEIQLLTVNAINSEGALADTYRLAFPDPTKNGILQFTDTIAYNASANTIQTKLAALVGIGSGNVSVQPVVNSPGVFTVEFQGTLADKAEPLLVSDATQLAGAFPINFGTSLGDIASLQTQGSFGITAGLSAGLTFGIDLHPSQKLEITPSVYSPAADVSIAAPVGSADNTVQLLTVKNASAGTYKLAYSDSSIQGTTGDIQFSDGASAIQTAINGISSSNLQVSVVLSATSGNEKVYTITFSKPTKPTLLTADTSSLNAPADTGVLSGTANFGVKLYNNPAVIPLTVQDGDAGDAQQTTLTLSNTTGTNRTATAGTTTFTADDVGRAIFSGNGRAVITGFTSDTEVTVDITSDFAGKDIASGDWTLGLNEVQKVTVANATGGTFTLSFNGQTTDPLAYNASAATVLAALAGANGIVSTTTDDVDVSKTGNTFTITFQGALAGADQPQLQADPSSLTNTTATDNISVSVTKDTSNTSLADLTQDVQTQINTTLANQSLTLGFLTNGALSTGARKTSDSTLTAGYTPRTSVPNDIDFTLKLVVGGTEKDITGQVRAVDLLDANSDGVLDSSELAGSVSVATLAAKLQTAINNALSQTGNAGAGGFAVVVAPDSGGTKLTFKVNAADSNHAPGANDTLEFIERAPIEADGGGGRISLSTTPVQLTSSATQQGVTLERQLDISAGFTDPAYQELGLLSAPTPLGSHTAPRIDFTLVVDGTSVPVSLTSQSVTSIDDLVSKLQTAVNNALDSSTLGSHDSNNNNVPDIQVFRVAQAGVAGNRIGFRADPGAVSKVALNVPELVSGSLNGAITELGYDPGNGPTQRSKSTEFFIQNVHLGGNFSIIASGVKATATLGFLSITAEGRGTLGDGLGIGTDSAIQLDPSTASSALGFKAPSNGHLTNDAAFVISDGTTESVGSLRAADTADSTTRDDLKNAIQTAINDALSAGGIAGTITVDIDSSGNITLKGSTGLSIRGGGKVVDASANFSLVNPIDGTDKLTPEVLTSALSHGKFFYDSAHQGSTTDANGNIIPTTGIISGTISGGVGARLDIAPDGVLAGLADTLNAHAVLSATSPNWLISPPLLNDALGFGTDPVALSTTAVSLSKAAPTNGRLTQNVSFIISDGMGHSGLGLLHASDTATFSNLGQLVTALQTAVNDALARMHAAGSTSTTTITVGQSNGNITLTASASGLSVQGNVLKLQFQGPDFNSILDKFRHLSLADILAGLKLLIGFLRNLDGSSGGGAIAQALAFKLPIINRSVSDLVDIAGKVSDKIDEIEANPSGSVQQLNDLLINAIGSSVTNQTTTEGSASANEVQQITFHNAVGGSFSLTSGKETTTPILFSADHTAVESALEQLTGITTVSVVKTISGLDYNYQITFTGPAHTNVSQVTGRMNILSLDTSNAADPILNIDLGIGTGVDLARPFDLDLKDAGLPSYLTDIIGVSASGNLDVKADANFHLALGLELGGGRKEFFLKTGASGTALTAEASASGNNLAFDAKLGPFGLFVVNGTASLNGGINLALLDPNSNGRLVVLDIASKPDAGLSLGATTGTGVTVTATDDTFLASDVGRHITLGAGEAVIKSFTDAKHVTVDITTAFASTTLAGGTWSLQAPSDLSHLGTLVGGNSITVTGAGQANLPLYVGTKDHLIPLDFGSSGGPLGFPSQLTALGTTARTLGNSIPNTGKLTKDVSFIISDGTHQVVGLLKASDTSAFTMTSQLQTALQNAINAALTALHTAGSASTTTITAGISNGKITLTASAGDLKIQDNDNALGASVDVVKILKGQTGAFSFTLPDFDFTNFKVPGIFALLSDPATMVDGLDSVLGTLQQGLSGQLFGTKLPFLGDLLAHDPAADFIGDIRNNLLKPFANLLRENNVNLAGLVNLIKQELVNVLGPGGPFDSLVDPVTGIHGLLKNQNPGTGPGQDNTIGIDDIIQTGVDPTNPLDPSRFIQFDFDIGKTFRFQAPAINFDLGIPALGIKANFQPEISINFNLHVGFGVDTHDGFYFVTNKPTDTTPEASVNVTADFGSTQANRASAIGRLLFLALNIKDGVPLDPTHPSTLTFSGLNLGGSIRVLDPNGDGRLTFAEMRTAKFSDIIKPSLSGGADLRAQATVDFSTIDASLANALPSVSTDLLVHFGFTAAPDKGFTIDPPAVALGNITLDLGSFITQFAEPILGKVKQILDPLAWLIGPDGFLNKRIPLISDLAGKTITGKDLVLLFDPEDGPKVIAFLDFVQNLYYLANLADSAAKDAQNGGLKLNFGDLILTGDSYFESTAFSTNFNKFFDKIINLGLPDLRSMSNLNSVQLPDLSNVKPDFSSKPATTTKSFTSGVQKPGGIDFALLKPATIFKLIMGQPDVTLVTVTLPEFGFNFFYRQSFPIFGPLVATFGGGVGATLNLSFGYDTHGLSQFLVDHNPVDLINGFFINALDPATGQPKPQITLNAQIAVGAALDLGIAKAGVEGGISATINFALDDLNLDGKVRLNEMAANLLANSFDPLAIFDISGELDFFLRAFLEINLGFFHLRKDFEFANLKLLSFDVPFTRPAILATQSGDTLTLNIGPNAAGRLHGDTHDGDETIHVANDGDKIYAWSDQFGVSQTVGQLFEFTGVKKIVADGGAGNDYIDLSGVTDSSVTADIHGGDGNDTAIGGAGNDSLSGDAGNDVLIGNGGNNTLDGGAGNDWLFGDALVTSLPSGLNAPLGSVPYAGAVGNNVIMGGDGDDTAVGGAGNDTYMGGAGNDTYVRSGGSDKYALADLGSVDHIMGTGVGNDTLDFTGVTNNLTFFLTSTSITAGFNQTPGTPGTSIGDFTSQLIVDDPTDITQILGGDSADTFNIYSTMATGLTIDGQKGNDQFIFHLPSSGDPNIKATINDTGNPWDSGNVIQVVDDGGVANTIKLTSSTIVLDANQGTPKEVVTYTAPAADANVLQIQVNTGGGDDKVTVANTAQTVPVRVDTGDGNDVVTVGDPATHTLSGIQGLTRPGLNAPVGVGPLVLVGGSGQDAVVLDDSADTTSGQTGNMTAFLESRIGFTNPVEVGVVSGLGMGLTAIDPSTGNSTAGTGRVEFEGFEAANVKLGSGGNHFTIGGDAVLNDLPKNRLPNIDPLGVGNTPTALSSTATALGAAAPDNGQLSVDVNFVLSQTVGGKTFSAGGTVTAASTTSFSSATDLQNALQMAVNAAVAQLVNLGGTGGTVTVGLDGATNKFTVAQTGGSDAITFRGQMFVNTITGMTAVTGGSGGDTYGVIGTNQLNRDTLDNSLNLVSVTAPHPAGPDTSNSTQTVTVSPTAHDVGYFTLQYAYDQTAPIPFGASPSVVAAALTALPLIGVDSEMPPQSNVTVTGSPDNYTITFVHALAGQAIAPLVAKIVPLVVLGGSKASPLPGTVDTFNVQSLRETSFFQGGAGADVFNLNADASTGAALTTNGINAEVTVNGQDGGDTYTVNLIGGHTASLINVFDTGAANSGVDTMTVNGQKDLANLFLLRASASELGLAFIGLLNSDASKSADQQPVERVNYDTNLEGITVNGGDLADRFFVDDTRAQITINGGKGADFFQIGQLYQTQRTSSTDTNIAAADGFATIQTTKGWLSNGISQPMTINGGDDNDTFVVFHNLAVLNLNGQKGDDTFIVQAFALVGSQDNKRAITDISGGSGADLVKYAVDAPVNIDGGDGLDTVIVIGTEFGDDFVITNKGVFGAGLNVNYVNIEHLVVDGAEGNDRFFVDSTAADLVTEIDGGLGSDLFSIGGPTPRNGIISKNLRGHNGIISHNVTSSDANSTFNGIDVQGVGANVADNDEPAVIVTPARGTPMVIQGDATYGTDSYTVVLSRTPLSGHTVTVTAIPPPGLLIWDPATMTWSKKGVQLWFDSSNWYIPQTVMFKVDDSATDVPNSGDIQMSVAETILVNGQPVPGLLRGVVSGATNVSSNPGGDPYGTLTDSTASFPGAAQGLPEGLRGAIVRIAASLTNPAAVGQTRLITASTSNTLTVDSPWTTLPTNTQYEISLFDGLALPNVRVKIFSTKQPAVAVSETEGNTSVAEDPSGTVANKAVDTIAVRLSQMPTGTVTVALDGHGQLQFSTDGVNYTTGSTMNLSFTSGVGGTWSTAQTVYVRAIDDQVVEGFRQVDLTLTASGGGYDSVAPQTLTVNVADNDAPGVRVLESNGSTNVAEFTNGEFGTGSGTITGAGFPAYDSYQVVLSKQPAVGETVYVNAVSEPTRTSRGGGLNGLRSFTQQLMLSKDNTTFGATVQLAFTHDNWDTPQTVYVHAIDNSRVDGTDTTVFPPNLQQANRIRGPLVIHGGPGADRTGLLERAPVMLPGEKDIKAHIGAVVSATEAASLTPATVTIHSSDLSVATLAQLGIAINHTDPIVPSDLVNLSIQITDGPAQNKIRIITAVTNNGDGTWTLTLGHTWFSPFTGDPAHPTDSSVPDGTSHYTLQQTNVNLLVDERDQSNLLQVYDADNPSSYNDPALPANTVNAQGVGQLFYDTTFQTGVDSNNMPTYLNMFRLTGLGMGGDRVIGGENEPGGITFDGLQNIDINLGSGNNHFTIANTPAGALTRLNTGAGDDLVDVKSVSGHTFVNTGAGNDVVNIHDDGHTLQNLLGLLTVSGDIPQAMVLRLVNGSAAQGTSINAVNDIQQVTVDATGGTFKLSLGGVSTTALAYNISAADLQTALTGLSTIGANNVTVTKAGNVYRIEFVAGKGGQAIDLLGVDDSGLANGLGVRDKINVDDSGSTANTVGLLTSSSLTGLSTQQVNEIQTIFVNASQGTFTLSYSGAATAPLAYNISAADLQTALQSLTGIKPGDVTVSRNDKVIVVRFQGNLANKDVAQLVATPGADLMLGVEQAGGGVNLVPGTVTVSTRVAGTSAKPVNDMQVVTVNATGGTYKLSLLNGTVVTGPIAYNASADAVQAALQAAIAVKDPAEQFQIDVTVNRYGNVYLIGFQGKLRRVNNGFGVDLLQADTTNLTGSVGVGTRMDGLNYFGIENLNIDTSQGNIIFSVQDTSAGSNGFAQAGGVAVTNVHFHGGANSIGQVYVSSNADLDFASATPAFDFLTGNLNDLKGALNLNTDSGRHRLMISNEASTVGATDARITDTAANLANTPANLGLDSTAEIWITGLAPAGISYQANRTTGNFFDGVTYWTSSGDDKVLIDGTHNRAGGRTMTLLNTGLGKDNVTANLTAGQDGFFALNTAGGSQSPSPVNNAVSDDDTVNASGSSLPLVIFGGWGNDSITGGSGNDIILGDFGRVQYLDPATGQIIASLGAGGHGDFTSSQIVDPTWIFSRDRTLGGKDTVQGGDGQDIVVGGAADDMIDGGAKDDLIFGDAVQLKNRLSGTIASPVYDITNPRFQALAGTLMYDPATGQALVNGAAKNYRDPDGSVPSWASWQIQSLYHSTAIQTANDNSFGNDYIAGGGGNDEIFGQLGNDTIQGDGSIAGALAAKPVSYAVNSTTGAMTLTPSFDAPTDGNDYIEGGGGSDLVLGGQGQDDIIGGSSSLFTLTTPDLRPDSSTGDVIFGGSGNRIARNDAGDTSNGGHATDADYILGDNGNIYRLVGTNGVDSGTVQTPFLKFNYDSYIGSVRIIPRAINTLDYTPGAAGINDIGGPDTIHGEAGDDFIHGEVGNDVLLGDGQDDQIIGGAGNDRIYGGTGEDNILGDDGRFVLSRDGLAEPLYGVTTANAQSNISIPGPFTGAYTYVTGRMNMQTRLLASGLGGNDLIYGGLGDDWIHAGTGDDAVSGAEAQAPWFNDLPVGSAFYANGSYTVNFNGVPVDPNNPLGYDPTTRKLAAYDANNPLTKITNFFLNFDAVDSSGNKIDDGTDRVFGDDGNDWLVGGTDNNRLFGGKGDDLMNADNYLDTNTGLNNIPDQPLYADRDFVYGGDGLDVMIANTGGDRMLDWSGEFNTYLVPFAPFGEPTIYRAPSPWIQKFLLALGKDSGADQTMTEPSGELGLFTQSDPQWQANKGAPRDPQPGNIGGTQRDTQGGPEALGPSLPLVNTQTVAPSGANATAAAAVAANSFDVTLNKVYISSDPSNPNQLALYVSGTNNNDTILVQPGKTGYLDVVINGKDQGQFAISSANGTIGRIVIYGDAGNDTITVSSSVTIDTAIYGGAGNDTITGDGGNNFIDGGAGNDVLNGGAGRNILIGGLGTDTINGGAGDDVMIGGTWKYSEDLDAVYYAIGVWKDPTLTYAQRTAGLRTGGTDGLYIFSTATILDDSAVDYLYGKAGLDWFWIFGKDLTDKQSNETIN